LKRAASRGFASIAAFQRAMEPLAHPTLRAFARRTLLAAAERAERAARISAALNPTAAAIRRARARKALEWEVDADNADLLEQAALDGWVLN
jgi:hypothetical protein